MLIFLLFIHFCTFLVDFKKISFTENTTQNLSMFLANKNIFETLYQNSILSATKRFAGKVYIIKSAKFALAKINS